MEPGQTFGCSALVRVDGQFWNQNTELNNQKNVLLDGSDIFQGLLILGIFPAG